MLVLYIVKCHRFAYRFISKSQFEVPVMMQVLWASCSQDEVMVDVPILSGSFQEAAVDTEFADKVDGRHRMIIMKNE